ncbi:hypothetical protein ACFFRR_007304 [Megaselia abdita]
MNSCLADLSRLIPPHYQRKGRGRIEKTEIIEMAIRHLKHLQTEVLHKEREYQTGYNDCMKEVGKYLYDSQMQDYCCRLLQHLQDHCDEVVKNDFLKTRCPADNISASSGSPHNNFHPSAPLSQLRDMLPSDVEHSNDHSDVKDLSFRTHNQQINNTPAHSQPHQAAVITSTGSSSALLHHDSSNHDFESSREPPSSNHESDITHSPPHPAHHSVDSILQSVRLRNFSESSHDIEHNNNYKFKNHIKERFNHDVHLHDDSTVDTCIAPPSNLDTITEAKDLAPKRRRFDTTNTSSSGTPPRVEENNTARPLPPTSFSDIKNEIAPPKINGTSNGLLKSHAQHFAVPIFALHTQGYYIPLHIDYNVLIPFLNGIDLLDKSFCPVPVFHPVNLNVNYCSPHISTGVNGGNNSSGASIATSGVSAFLNKQQVKTTPKIETNGW